VYRFRKYLSGKLQWIALLLCKTHTTHRARRGSCNADAIPQQVKPSLVREIRWWLRIGNRRADVFGNVRKSNAPEKNSGAIPQRVAQ
jgi:hypothetical protein